MCPEGAKLDFDVQAASLQSSHALSASGTLNVLFLLPSALQGETASQWLALPQHKLSGGLPWLLPSDTQLPVSRMDPPALNVLRTVLPIHDHS